MSLRIQGLATARGSTAGQRVVLTGVLCIIGGEAFCILGPLRYEQIVHITCHVVLYSGVVLVCVGAGLHWAGRSRAWRQKTG
jgi:hypothetical protein